CAAAAGLSLLSVASVFHADFHTILETNLGKLRNKESIEHGSAYLSRYLDQIFRHYLSPIVLLPRSKSQTQALTQALRDYQKKDGPDSLIRTVQTLDDFIPKDQPEKMKILGDIRDMLRPSLLRELSPKDRTLVHRFLTPEVYHPIRIQDLPPLVLRKFTEKDGSVGRLVLVEPPMENQTWESANLFRFVAILREIVDRTAPGTAVAGTLPITSDMASAVSKDGPRATLFAFLAVVLLVFLLFRDFRISFQVLFALGLGVLWLSGMIFGFRLKINFLNFIALPITFGIGVDYGVNIFQRYRTDQSGDIISIIRQTGGAVGLCSLTTIIGYTSLLIAGNQGFVSFGTLAVAGELSCVTAAVVALPAWLAWRDRRNRAKLLRLPARAVPALIKKDTRPAA
ncbi:MAG: MMPL family transporter, partial [Bdellovibrionota bacterium]